MAMCIAKSMIAETTATKPARVVLDFAKADLTTAEGEVAGVRDAG